MVEVALARSSPRLHHHDVEALIPLVFIAVIGLFGYAIVCNEAVKYLFACVFAGLIFAAAGCVCCFVE